MEQHDFDQLKEKTNDRRPVRNKRYNRRHFGEDKRPPKRLFTPEIKKFLKDWLIRRRENPYPNREEKKILAIQTGLTYIQVCNWFANWRRKLKNAGKEPQRKTWGHLIKTYNSQVHGNVEHFSICSEDSIWHEMEQEHLDDQLTTNSSSRSSPIGMQQSPNIHPYRNSFSYAINTSSAYLNNNNETIQAQCFLISSTTPEDLNLNPFFKHQQQQLTNKYKNHIMEKYVRDCQKPLDQYPAQTADLPAQDDVSNKPSMITKWLESAENFKPSEKNYLHWTLTNGDKKKLGNMQIQTCRKLNDLISPSNYQHSQNSQHGREELDAAEALTRLANTHACVKIT